MKSNIKQPTLLNFLDTSPKGYFGPSGMEFLNEYFKVIHAQRDCISEGELIERCCRANPDAVLAGWGCEKIVLTDAALEAAPDLKVIAYLGGSMRGILKIHRYRLSSLILLNTSTIIAQHVAESTIGHMIHMIRRVKYFAQSYPVCRLKGHDDRVSFESSLYLSKVGLIGLGQVGQHVNHLLKPFGCEVVAYDPYCTKELASELNVCLVTLEELLRGSDIVSLHAAAVAENYHLLNAQTLALMKEGAVLINTARGELIDNKALYKEIDSGRLWVVCDVLEGEPDGSYKQDPLFELAEKPNFVLTPHIAGIVPKARAAMLERLLQETYKILTGPSKGSELIVSSDATRMA